MIQDHTDLLQQARGDVLAAEDVVNVSTLTVDLLCQPCYGLIPLFHYLFDSFSDVHTFEN